MTIEELANDLCLSKNQLRYLIRKWGIPHTQPGVRGRPFVYRLQDVSSVLFLPKVKFHAH